MFNGSTEQAFNFYKEVFNGEITAMQRYGDVEMPGTENCKQLIMHAILKFDDNTLMASDYKPEDEVVNQSNIHLSIDIMEVFILEDTFNKLAQGGTITMPLQDTFWGARFGMIKDKFGINWMLNCDLN